MKRNFSWVARATLPALVASLAACGGTAESPASGGDSDGGSGGFASAGAPASGGQATPAAGSTAGGSAGTLSAGGSDAGGAGLAEQPLLPLVPEHVSKFVFSPIDPNLPMTNTCASR